MIQKCRICSQHRTQHPEPLIPTSFPEYPWQRVATDLFEWRKASYLLLIDYYSRYIEISSLSSTTSKAVIQRMKGIFGRHGIPECLISDNGPQFSSREFQQFSKEYKFEHITSSPNYPQANGEAERGVQTVKALLNKSDDPYLALLAYRSTPLANGYSPAELLMGRKLRTTVPIISSNLQPRLPDSQALRQKEGEMRRQRQKKTFDSCHKTQSLHPLSLVVRLVLDNVFLDRELLIGGMIYRPHCLMSLGDLTFHGLFIIIYLINYVLYFCCNLCCF